MQIENGLHKKMYKFHYLARPGKSLDSSEHGNHKLTADEEDRRTAGRRILL